jgi:23S rRNA (adenine2503-C2)-methyltransferase
MNPTPLIYDLDFESLLETLTAWGEPTYRARQVWQGLYQNLWQAPPDFTNLPGKLRQRLFDEFRFSNLTPLSALQSSDGETRKTLFQLPDGRAIETVLMHYSNRRTLCISTQAGCAMGCVFCATGEIVEQVLFYARQLHALGERVTNVVVMGMGEPFHNYDATMNAIDRMNHPDGFNFGARRFTISTVGLVPAIRRFAEEKRQVNLAVSLHAADDDLRSSLLPINRRYPLDVLFQACHEYIESTHRRITFEWALIQGINDTLDQARELCNRLEGMLCHVNVIPLNPTKRYLGQASTHQQAHLFKDELDKHGIPCTIRVRRGIDIQAGCGQLAIQQAQSN